MIVSEGQRFFKIPQVCTRWGIGRTHFYEMATRHSICLVHLGRASRVPLSEIERVESELMKSSGALC